LKIGIVIFPGSNCDYDAYQAFKMVEDVDVEYLWHGSDNLRAVDAVILPGGFSYGDYLRAGSIARFSPIMKKIIEFAHDGGFVMGICNGFQVLLESGLLPGALMRNSNLRFMCKEIILRVENPDTAFTSRLKQGQLIRMPVAHGEGNYHADPLTLKKLESEGRVIFRYVDKEGVVVAESNPNGSINGIAGIINEKGNVLGMMPHPERATEKILGSIDGWDVIRSLCAAKS
jgi:phosphoribosylformylglycinamidine synthase I